MSESSLRKIVTPVASPLASPIGSPRVRRSPRSPFSPINNRTLRKSSKSPQMSPSQRSRGAPGVRRIIPFK
uniref:NUMA1 n=1 Tax=Steinernema glaseri TaxID=37863 RepID=A0A1I7YBR3_9BILA